MGTGPEGVMVRRELPLAVGEGQPHPLAAGTEAGQGAFDREVTAHVGAKRVPATVRHVDLQVSAVPRVPRSGCGGRGRTWPREHVERGPLEIHLQGVAEGSGLVRCDHGGVPCNGKDLEFAVERHVEEELDEAIRRVVDEDDVLACRGDLPGCGGVLRVQDTFTSEGVTGPVHAAWLRTSASGSMAMPEAKGREAPSGTSRRMGVSDGTTPSANRYSTVISYGISEVAAPNQHAAATNASSSPDAR